MAHLQLKEAPADNILLVVDDRQENLAAMEALLEDGEWQVRTVDSGEAALKCLLEEQVGLVLLDVQMPRMDGFEVARLMRSSPLTRFTPIIFISAIAHTQDAVLLRFRHGPKPFPGSSTSLSLSPLREWHSFANVPAPDEDGFDPDARRAGP